VGVSADDSAELRQRLAALADALPGLVAFIDAGGIYRDVNSAYERWFGHPREHYVDHHVRDALGADVYRQIEPQLTAALAGQEVRFRERVRYAAGAREVDVRYTPIRGERGTIVGVAVLVLDVSAEAQLADLERQRFEQQRRATARLQRLLAVATQLASASTSDEVARAIVETGVDALDATLGGMWLVSPDASELVMVRARGFGDDQAAFARVALRGDHPLAACVATRTAIWIRPRVDVGTHAASDGPQLPASLAVGIAPIAIGDEVVGCLMFAFGDDHRVTTVDRTYLEVLASHAADAIRRARLYAELRDIGETREATIQASPAAITVLDRHGVVQTWNPAAERIFGWRADEVIGTFLPAIPDDKHGEFVTNLANVLAGQVITGLPTRRLRKDGTLVDVHLHAAPVRRSDGEMMCVWVITDISENARLLREADEARREAEAANRAKDQFLAMLGHELRNPLAPIATALELMAMRGPAHARERATIARQVDHLSRLVDDLLDISRITRGTVELSRARTPVAAIVSRGVEMASPLLEQRRHELHLDVARDLDVDGDATRLAQVIANLLTNAARYTDPGGRIRVRAARAGDDAVITVTDTGVGIAPEMLPHVFEMFVQAPQTLARTRGGLGLGLAIVKSLVELHGGRVAVRSEGAGQGSTFEVRLPALGPAVAEPPRSARAPAPAARRLRILVVDDNQDAAALLGELLESHGHEIRTAHDGPAALRVVEDFQPELALLDIGLPVMDGYELALRLRARPELHAMRLIALSGYGQEADRLRSRAAGFEHHLAKPVTIAKLLELIGG